MKKLGWYAVSAAAAAFILGGGLLLAANLYVQSRAVQQRIRQALSASLRMPVSLRKTTFTPWDGLRIDGITIKHGKASPKDKPDTQSVDFLTASSFRVRFAIGPLLQKQLVISDVLLDRPQLSWTQDDDDRWRLPPEKASSNRKRTDHAAQTLLPEDPPVPVNHAEEKTETPTKAGRNDNDTRIETALEPPERFPFSSTSKVSINKFRLRDGNLNFLNHKRGLLGRFEEVDLDAYSADLQHAEGHASFGKTVLPRAGLKLALLKSDFIYDQKEGLDLNNTRAMLAHGNLFADYHLHTGLPGTPFNAQCRMENVSIGELIMQAGGKTGLIDGQLQGSLQVSGFSDAPEHREATGQFQLVNAQIHNFPLFQAVGTALGIDDLRLMRFKKAQLDYRLGGTTLHIDPLILVSSNLQVSAVGSYHLREDRLDLHARLIIDSAVSRQLPQIVEQQFKPYGDGNLGDRFVEFDIAGPLGKPSSNLYQKMLPDTVTGLLDNFLRTRQKRIKQKPKPAVEETVPPRDVLDESGN